MLKFADFFAKLPGDCKLSRYLSYVLFVFLLLSGTFMDHIILLVTNDFKQKAEKDMKTILGFQNESLYLQFQTVSLSIIFDIINVKIHL